MSNTKLPGFAGEASLYRSVKLYQIGGYGRNMVKSEGVLPQLKKISCADENSADCDLLGLVCGAFGGAMASNINGGRDCIWNF